MLGLAKSIVFIYYSTMKKFFLLLFCTIVLVGAGIWYIIQPKSLGISYTPADLSSVYKKVKVVFEPLPVGTSPETSLIVLGSHPLDETFSSEELTAAADNRASNYALFPFKRVQIKINTDGSVESSATVNYFDAVKYLVALGVSSQDIASAAQKFKIPNTNLPVYLKVSGSITNNISNISVQKAQIAGINIPDNFVRQYGSALNGLVDSVIKSRQPSYDIQKLVVENGKVHYTGTAPDKEQAVKKP